MDLLPRLVEPDPVRFLMVTALVAFTIEKLPLLMMPLEALIEPDPRRARVSPLSMLVTPV